MIAPVPVKQSKSLCSLSKKAFEMKWEKLADKDYNIGT